MRAPSSFEIRKRPHWDNRFVRLAYRPQSPNAIGEKPRSAAQKWRCAIIDDVIRYDPFLTVPAGPKLRPFHRKNIFGSSVADFDAHDVAVVRQPHVPRARAEDKPMPAARFQVDFV